MAQQSVTELWDSKKSLQFQHLPPSEYPFQLRTVDVFEAITNEKINPSLVEYAATFVDRDLNVADRRAFLRRPKGVIIIIPSNKFYTESKETSPVDASNFIQTGFRKFAILNKDETSYADISGNEMTVVKSEQVLLTRVKSSSDTLKWTIFKHYTVGNGDIYIVRRKEILAEGPTIGNPELVAENPYQQIALPSQPFT